MPDPIDPATPNPRDAVLSLLTADTLTRTDNSTVPTLHRPDDLFDVLGATPDQFHVDGVLDADAVATFLEEHATERPYLLKTPASSDSDEDERAGSRRSPNPEAAKHRQRAKNAEAERDRLLGVLTDTRRGLLDGVLQGDQITAPDGTTVDALNRAADMWEVLGGTPDQFFAEDGSLDTGALVSFITESTQGREYLRKVTPTPPGNLQRKFHEAIHGSRTLPAHLREATPTTMHDALRSPSVLI